MIFRDALNALKLGHKVKLSSWSGYWALENNTIMIHCKDGRVLDIRNSDDILYTLSNIASDDWEVLSDDYKLENPIKTYKFSEAVRLMLKGEVFTRLAWMREKDRLFYFVSKPSNPFDTHFTCHYFINSSDINKGDCHLTALDEIADDWILFTDFSTLQWDNFNPLSNERK